MTEDDCPLVTVIIPTYYRNGSLEDAVQSAKNQTYEPIEIIVVDDSGTNHAESTVAPLGVTYVAHAENRGGNPARTTGCEHANGQYVQFLDDDDELLETKIERQVDVFEMTDGVGVVYCGIEYENRGAVVPVSDGQGAMTVLPDPDCRGDVLHDALRFGLNPCQTGTMLIDADVLATLLPLTARDAADDIGLKIRLAERTQFEFVDEALFQKGEAADHRAASPAFADELERIITDDHAALYADAPREVYREAMCEMYTLRGYFHLEREYWSIIAIHSFFSAIRYTDGPLVIDIGRAVASLFGRPGIAIAVMVEKQLR
jgi:glycosyltransferase involved in cell wall biosynthesis